MKKLLLLTVLFCSLQTIKSQWQNQNAGFTNRTLGFYEFSIVNENVVWAICYDGIGGLFGSNPILDFTRTTNGGTTWTGGQMGTNTALAFSNISAISETEAWVAMHKFDSSGGGGLFHTIDGGITWTQSNIGLIFNDNSFPNFVYFKDALNGIAGGDSNDGYFEIYKTNNGGTTWTRTPQANIPTPLIGGEFGWFDGYAVVGNTVWFGTTKGQMYKSTDFGTTWTISTVNVAENAVYEIAFNDDALHGLTHVRTMSGATRLYSTIDGGTIWSQIPLNTIPIWRRDRICSVPGTNTFVSTSTQTTKLGSSYTKDNGVTWTLIEDDTQKAACRFLNSNTGWSGGFFNDNPSFEIGDGIFKWDNSISLSTNTIDLFDLSVEVYPNPSNGNITISLPEFNKNKTKIEVFDLIGRNTFREEYSNINASELEIDLSNLSKGNYILKVSNNNQFTIKKISLKN